MTTTSLLAVETVAIEGPLLLTPKRFGDARGWFSETWHDQRIRAAGVDLTFVQDNQSFSAPKGTLRGLHFQLDPAAQDKLIRVLTGRIRDVAVDIRAGSPTFGKHVSVELSADDGRQFLVPRGFAHGFVTLEPDTQVFYKVTGYYSPEHDRGIAFDDPDLGIDWGLPADGLTLSPKDMAHPRLAAIGPQFS